MFWKSRWRNGGEGEGAEWYRGDALECVGDGLGEGEEEREGEEEGVPEEEMNWVDMGSALTAQQIPAKPKYVD